MSRLLGLDDQAKNVLNDQQINEALFENGVTRLADKDELLVIHDGSDIRKEYASKLDDLGKVRSLNGKIINGYNSFNSIAVDLHGKGITPLNTEIYRIKEDDLREKLVAKTFAHKHIKFYAKIQIKTKVHQDASCVVEWGEKLNGYAIVRVQLINREGNPIFKSPMLLITNKEVMGAEQAISIYHIYLKRPKIEGVFKFLKEVLGWEDSQIQDFTAMKTLLTFCYFVAAYFYEIESALVEHEVIKFIAELGGGKGKVTRTYVLMAANRAYQDSAA